MKLNLEGFLEIFPAKAKQVVFACNICSQGKSHNIEEISFFEKKTDDKDALMCTTGVSRLIVQTWWSIH